MIPAPLGVLGLGVVAVFAIAGLALPLHALSLQAEGWGNLFDPGVLAVVRATVVQALISTGFSVLIGLPLGLAVGALDSRARSRVMAFLRIPFAVPTVVAGTAWVAWLGRSGALAGAGLPLDIAYTFTAVVLAHVFFNAPWVACLVAEARRGVPESQLEAARSLGAEGPKRFAWVLWPAIAPALASAAAQVFALCSMSFALVLILGGGPPVDTLETSLYSRIRFGSLDIGGAVACALWELVITLAPWGLVLLFTPRVPHETVALSRGPARASAARRLWVTAAALFFVLPYVIVFAPRAVTALLDVKLQHVLHPAAVVSLKIAAVSAAGALLVTVAGLIAGAWVSRRSRWAKHAVDLVLAFPSGISVLVLGLGFWLAYRAFIDPFAGSLLAMCILQILLFTPLALRSLWPVARGTRKRLLEAAATLGASPVRAFCAVEWPRWRGPVFATGALVAASSLGEVAALSLFYSENLIPMPLLISRWMAQYHFEAAQGLSALLLVLATGVILVFSEASHAHS